MRHLESISHIFPRCKAIYTVLFSLSIGFIPYGSRADVFQTPTGQEGQPAVTQPITPIKNAELAPDVHITWYGQSCFGFHSRSGDSLLTDPYDPARTGYPLLDIEHKVVTISHEHFDHNDLKSVRGNPIVVRNPGETGAGGLVLHGIRSRHDNEGGKLRGPNIIFTWRMGGVRFAHLGDLGQHRLTPAQLKAIGPVDVLLIPVGGVSTINGTEAQEIVKQIQPHMVIPMHYKTDALKIPLESVDSFLKSPYPVVNTGKSDFLLNSSSLPSKTTIFLMDYAHSNPTPGGAH